LVRKMEELGIDAHLPMLLPFPPFNKEVCGKRSVEAKNVLYCGYFEKRENQGCLKTEITGADKNKLIPTDIGIVVNDFLVEYFPDIVDYNFTAKVEKDFDKIAEGKMQWNKSIADFYKTFHPKVEETMNMRTKRKTGERLLGVDPKTGRQVSVKIGRYGALAQIGTADEEEKPLFAPLQRSQSIETITLEEALKLFELPRNLGEFRGKEMVVGIGRLVLMCVTTTNLCRYPKMPIRWKLRLRRHCLIEAKEKKKEKTIKTFPKNPAFGFKRTLRPYISFEKKNYKIPKGLNPEELSLDDCRKIIAESGKNKTKGGKKRRKSSSKK